MVTPVLTLKQATKTINNGLDVEIYDRSEGC